MSVIHSSVQGGEGFDIGDNISYSIMLDSSASQYLSRTFSSPTSNTSWCLSEFEKLGKLGVAMSILSAGDSEIRINASNQLELYKDGSVVATSTALDRDPMGHGHLFVRSNGTNVKGYFNTVEVVSYTGTMPDINSAVAHTFGKYQASSTNYYDGYRSLVMFVDGGGSLTPQDFVRQSAESGQFVNKSSSPTYGNNGFKLEFADPSFATYGLGKDTSGKGNHWTTNGSITSANQFTDTPTNNFCVWNVLNKHTTISTSKGNTRATGSGNAQGLLTGTIAIPSSGIWYVEFSIVAEDGSGWVGMASSEHAINIALGYGNGYGYCSDGRLSRNGITLQSLGTYTTGALISAIFDASGGTGSLTLYKGNVQQGTTVTGIDLSKQWYWAASRYTSGETVAINCGQQSWTYPTRASGAGAKALCTSNIPEGTASAPASFTGNASADGKYVWCNGTPETATINGNAVTWGTHADKTAGGIKLRTSSSSYNSSGSNTLSCTFLSPNRMSVFKYQTAKGNP